MEVDEGSSYSTNKTELLHNEETDLICETTVIRLKCRFGEIKPNVKCTDDGLFLSRKRLYITEG